MAWMTTYKQAGIQLGNATLAIGGNAYPLDDVLYAEVLDDRGQPVRQYVGKYDWLLLLLMLSWAVAALIFVFVLQWKGWFLILLLLNGGGALRRKLKELESKRSSLGYTLMIDTKMGPVYIYRSSNLLYSRIVAARINKAVKRRMLGLT